MVHVNAETILTTSMKPAILCLAFALLASSTLAETVPSARSRLAAEYTSSNQSLFAGKQIYFYKTNTFPSIHVIFYFAPDGRYVGMQYGVVNGVNKSWYLEGTWVHETQSKICYRDNKRAPSVPADCLELTATPNSSQYTLYQYAAVTSRPGGDDWSITRTKQGLKSLSGYPIPPSFAKMQKDFAKAAQEQPDRMQRTLDNAAAVEGGMILRGMATIHEAEVQARREECLRRGGRYSRELGICSAY